MTDIDEYKLCKGCRYSLHYVSDLHDDWVCAHPQATGIGHHRVTGKPQTSYTSQNVFFRTECKGGLKDE